MGKARSPQIPSPETTGPETDAHPPPADAARPVPVEHAITEIGALLHELEDVAAPRDSVPAETGERPGGQLVQARLGIASSLFTALQYKHAATAGHALRVALSCSAWASSTGIKGAGRDAVEIAALLHDIGVIGAPDRILSKPGGLNGDEAALMAQTRQMGLEILRQSCASKEVLEIIEHGGAWYDGSRNGFRLRGRQIPLGARMIAVAEAFDAMVTDHVYRPAMSHERAMTELFDCAGTQFDPELVSRFAELQECDQSQLQRDVADRWLHTLDPNLANSYWQLNCVPSSRSLPDIDSLFQIKLLENMYDAVVFVDAGGQVTLWNHGAERLTGMIGSTLVQRLWQPELLKMTDEKGRPVIEEDCPVRCAIRSGVQSLRRLTIWGRAGRPVSVDTHAIPVVAENGTTLGAVLLFHDASSETSLEERCQNLYEKATKDPLTQVANRAELDRVHQTFVAAHRQQRVPCSMILGDLDLFKGVNDTYGHQAGDDVIKSLATLLKNACRSGDLVARYGGEEFVILCADCDNAAAARRAERIRKTLSEIRQPKMNGRMATVSFGVTEIQPGDTPETMFRRADRALLMAKANGRNTVVQLGVGFAAEEPEAPKAFWSRKDASPEQLFQRTMITPVPVKMAIEKLRGFVDDHEAKIVKIDGNQIRLDITARSRDRTRRQADRPVGLRIDVLLEEERHQKNPKDEQAPRFGGALRTKIQLQVSPLKNRDRRREDLADRVREVMVSFRSYLMASEEDEEDEEEETSPDEKPPRTKRILAPWLARKIGFNR